MQDEIIDSEPIGTTVPLQYTSADKLAALGGVKEEDIELHDFEEPVRMRIRGLTKQEQMDIGEEAKVGDEVDTNKVQLIMFEKGVMAPKLGQEAISAMAATWPAGTFDRIIKRITELSGATEEAATEARKSFRN